MLSYMTTTGVGSSPLAVAALALVQGGATAADLERRFSENGADLRPGIVEDLLSGAGIARVSIRIARGSPAREYVLSSLGRRLVEHGAWTDAAVPMKDLERMRTDFLSIIAHELRTPITVMRTLTGLLLDPASEPTAEQRRTMLETMERNAERMQHLIGEILDLARYRAGTIGLQLRPFDATELAESAVATIRPLAEGRNQTVDAAPPARSRSARVRRPPAPRSGAAEPRRQCSALRAGRRADHRAPPASGRRHDPLVGDRRRTGHLRWQTRHTCSSDSSLGDTTRTQAQEGVGLGLPRALAIAQAHGGSIEVRSRPGHGSTFTLVVPAAGPPEEA